MKTWLIEYADAIETWQGYGHARGGSFAVEDGRGVRVMVGPGFIVRRAGEEPDERTEKPKPATADQIGEAFGRELGKHLKPETPNEPGNPNGNP